MRGNRNVGQLAESQARLLAQAAGGTHEQNQPRRDHENGVRLSTRLQDHTLSSPFVSVRRPTTEVGDVCTLCELCLVTACSVPQRSSRCQGTEPGLSMNASAAIAHPLLGQACQEPKPTGGKVLIRRELTRREPLGRAIGRGGSSEAWYEAGILAYWWQTTSPPRVDRTRRFKRSLVCTPAVHRSSPPGFYRLGLSWRAADGSPASGCRWSDHSR